MVYVSEVLWRSLLHHHPHCWAQSRLPIPVVVFLIFIFSMPSRSQWPPVSMRDNETDEERRQRLNDEAEAKRVSDKIDRQLDQDRQQRSKSVGPKILLLGTRYSFTILLRVLNLRVWFVHGHLYHYRTGGIRKIYYSKEFSTAFCAQSLRT